MVYSGILCGHTIGVKGKETRVSSFARLKCTPLSGGLAEIHFPVFSVSGRKAGKLAFQKTIRNEGANELRKVGESIEFMGIFDPDEVISVYSLQQAIEDGVLVEIFKNRWAELSGGKPIVATRHLFEEVSRAGLREIWNEFAHWQREVMPVLPEEEKLFSTKLNGLAVWVIEDGSAFTLMYPEDY